MSCALFGAEPAWRWLDLKRQGQSGQSLEMSLAKVWCTSGDRGLSYRKSDLPANVDLLLRKRENSL